MLYTSEEKFHFLDTISIGSKFINQYDLDSKLNLIFNYLVHKKS